MAADPDVIIIGAGAAGLAAAKELRKQGVSFQVVEGSHRIGGRAYSEEIAPGVWFDLGCSYLHQAQQNPFIEIADDLGFTLGRDFGNIFSSEKAKASKNGVALTAEEMAAYIGFGEEWYATIDAAAKRGDDRAVAEVVDLENEYALPYIYLTAVVNTLDVDQQSILDAADFEDGPDVPILEGYGSLVSAWGADVPVSLNNRVERIDWSGPGVAVETAKGTLKGRAVLSTVSNGILAANDIAFTPNLPDWKFDAIHGLPTGTANKICLHFDKDVFGPDGRGSHKVWNDDGEVANFEASVMGQNTAIVFTGGRHGTWLEKQGQEAGHAFALDRVAEAFGNDIRKHVTRSIVTAWTTDPWTKGSYSGALAGHGHQRRELAKSLENRLFFAGEAATVGDQGCCHGAYKSGIRAAREIASCLT
ncbi:flavin monoamine oxidase family protein [Rhodovibrionaceae bacterium A322]